MGIFKNITKTLKKAAPLIGSAIGMYIGGPAGYAALGGALGGGIGSLVGGGDTDDALKAALLGGIGGYAAQGSFTGAGVPVGKQVVGAADSTQYGFGAAGTPTKIAVTDYPAMKDSSFFSSLIPESTIGKVALGTGILGLAGGFGEEKMPSVKMRPDPIGRTRLGTGRIGNKLYNLDDPDERRQYFEDNRKRQGGEDIEPKESNDFYDVVNPGIDDLRDPFLAAAGGEVTGPGTGTSDSVPARLSDGEFVVTAKAVRGAGGGDRDVGAARMYDMMSQLERVA